MEVIFSFTPRPLFPCGEKILQPMNKSLDLDVSDKTEVEDPCRQFDPRSSTKVTRRHIPDRLILLFIFKACIASNPPSSHSIRKYVASHNLIIIYVGDKRFGLVHMVTATGNV
jgi:hypothetical protein